MTLLGPILPVIDEVKRLCQAQDFSAADDKMMQCMQLIEASRSELFAPGKEQDRKALLDAITALSVDLVEKRASISEKLQEMNHGREVTSAYQRSV